MALTDQRAGRRRPSLETLVSIGVVVACAAYTIAQLHPRLLVANTTAAGGDMGAHVWGPAHLRDHLLGSGRLTGWAPDWYAGFPAYVFYMVVPSLFVVALDVVLPYNIAFKLVSVAGLAALPAAAWALGRLGRLPFPGPPLLAVAATAFLFDRSFSIYGGNIASTLAGEFAFSHSLAFSLVFLGVVLRGLETGRHRALAAVLLALTALTHVIPAIFAVVAGLIALTMRADRHRLRWAFTTGVVGAALTSFWTVPFVWRHPYLNDMGWERVTAYWERLLPGSLGEAASRLAGGSASADVPGDITWVAVLAVVGIGVSIAFRRRLGIFLTIVAVVAAAGFLLVPQGRLWNARLLPFWYLALYLLAAVAAAEVIRSIAVLAARRPSEEPSRIGLVTGSIVATLVVMVVLGLPLRSLPFGSTADDGTYHWPTRSVGVATTDRSFVPDWARWNYSGYERKEAWPELRSLVALMDRIGQTEGCGRAMWEYESELNRFGTPMAPMLLPYWTDGCIASMEGLYFEASVTTPYHFLNQSLLSDRPSRAQRGLPYRDLDVAEGVEHLQLLGVRYYLAFSDRAVAQADDVDDLSLLATSESTEVRRNDELTEVTWHVYEVADADLVVPLAAEPVVLDDVSLGGKGWLDAAVPWYLDTSRRDVMLAADGPPAWARVSVEDEPARRPVGTTVVSDVEEGVDTISFDVSRPGVPVLVKTSYFPNWQASGAEGPWRVAPNLMVVVPTSTSVELSYGTTPVDWLAWAMTAGGVVGVVLLARQGAVAFPARTPRRRRGDDDPVADTGSEEPLDDDAAVETDLLLAPRLDHRALDDATAPPDGVADPR
ncbi:MAG TPA: hypothetical protein VMN58_10930 [Acidimicrobiales bacterium]|nr:hypothetical protein [Acidimicrobiales bacterium]